MHSTALISRLRVPGASPIGKPEPRKGSMATTTKIGFEEFRRLQEAAGETVRYELDEGELILTPSPTPWHDLISFRLRSALAAFVKTHELGVTVAEIDFRLAKDVVRKPDVAFISKQNM